MTGYVEDVYDILVRVGRRARINGVSVQALCTRYFALFSVPHDVGAFKPVIILVPSTPWRCLSERAWPGVQLLSDFSAHR
jgi:hypothetical protein